MVPTVSAYPRGAAGLGLVLLRLQAAAMALCTSGGLCPCPAWAALPLGLVLLAMTLGLFTRAAAAISFVLIAALAVDKGGASGLHLATDGLCTGALILIGPGRYSIDSKLFGHREIRLPGRPRHSGGEDHR